MAIVFALNLNLPSFDKPKTPSGQENTADKNSKPSPEKEKWQQGKTLFKSNCAACHNPKSDGTGPALLGVTDRWKAAGSYKGKTGEQWLYMWIKNWNDPVNAGYKYAIDLKNSRPSQMNVFSNLSDKDIEAILFYVNTPDAFSKANVDSVP
jgi:mono/diheme cytochrome c family protein